VRALKVFFPLLLTALACTKTPVVEYPVVATKDVTNIGMNSAISGGEIHSTGITACGVCWSTHNNPTTSDSKSTDQLVNGSYVSQITGLQPNTAYFVRAYAVNKGGTGYGLIRTFTTLPTGALPSLLTMEAATVSMTTALSGGTITNAGVYPINAKGVCWSTSPNPDITASHTNEGKGSASFTSQITGLFANTTYYARAYASNDIGTAYGNQITFTTSSTGSLPTLSTYEVSFIYATTATCGGNIMYEGSSPVTARGVCWSTAQDPTTSDAHTSNGTGGGYFVSSLTGLTPSTKYYVRSYAVNEAGTAYGNQVEFTSAASK
jgi:hypothetical protein